MNNLDDLITKRSDLLNQVEHSNNQILTINQELATRCYHQYITQYVKLMNNGLDCMYSYTCNYCGLDVAENMSGKITNTEYI